MKLSPLTPLLAAVLALAGCADTTPLDRRIAKNPAMYGQLADDEKHLVVSGRIKEGMRKDAVYLAWGPADNITHGEKDGKSVETWYYGTRDPYAGGPTWNIGFGQGYGGGYGSIGYGTSIESSLYAQDFYNRRSMPFRWVTFHENRVVQWEESQPPAR